MTEYSHEEDVDLKYSSQQGEEGPEKATPQSFQLAGSLYLFCHVSDLLDGELASFDTHIRERKAASARGARGTAWKATSLTKLENHIVPLVDTPKYSYSMRH